MGGNGTDQGHVIAMLQQVIVTLADHGTRCDRIERDVPVLRHDVSLPKFEIREVKQDITNLQQTVADHHGAVVGQGIAFQSMTSASGVWKPISDCRRLTTHRSPA